MLSKNSSCPVTVTSVITASMVVAIASSFFAYFGYKHDGVGMTPTHRPDLSNAPCIAAFQLDLQNPIEMDASNRALSLIQDTYRQDYYNSSISHHHFVRTAPAAIRETLSDVVWTDSTLKQVRRQFETRSAIRDRDDATSRNNLAGGGIRVIQDVFDEIYIMRNEFDLLDEKKIHYDGNLKLPGICTIRALTYLLGKDATLVALTSQQNYTTRSHTSIVLDFDRELHYVSTTTSRNNNPNRTTRIDPAAGGEPRPEPRVMIKSALHVVMPGTHPFLAHFRIMLHRIMLFGARSFRRAFESKSNSNSKSQSDAPSKSNVWMMAVDNLMRSMNKIHMILPLLLIGLPLGAICLAPVFYPFQFLPYVALIIVRCLFHTKQIAQQCAGWLLILMACAAVSALVYGPRSVRIPKWNTTPNNQTKKTMFQTSNFSLAGVSSFPADNFRANNIRLLLFHIAWVGLCIYVERNAEMANKILLAPWQQVINLDDLV